MAVAWGGAGLLCLLAACCGSVTSEARQAGQAAATLLLEPVAICPCLSYLLPSRPHCPRPACLPAHPTCITVPRLPAWPAVLVEHFADEFNAQLGGEQDVRSAPRAMAKLRKQVARTKHVLSANSEAGISVEELWQDRDFRSSITRERFEQLAGERQAAGC